MNGATIRSTRTEWRRGAIERLRRSGHRVGDAREAVITAVSRQACCRSASELHEGLRDEGRSTGLASVYRALDLLHELGLTQRVDLGDGEVRFEPLLPGGEHHHHAVCDRCERVTVFEDDRLERAIDSLADRIGYEPRAHDIVLRGRCPHCEEAG